MSSNSTANAPVVQPGAEHGPGRFRAVLTFDAPTAEIGRHAAAALLTELESPKLSGGDGLKPRQLKLTVGISIKLLEGHAEYARLLAALDSALSAFQSATLFESQPKVLVQVAAETEDERTYALCMLERVFDKLTLREQFLGGQHLFGREAFGYRDGVPPNPDEQSAATPASGVSFLLYQDCRQKLDEFYRRSEAEQNAVIGHSRDLNADGQYDEVNTVDSHVAIGKQTRPSGKPLARRSISYREYRKAGIAFLATAAQPGDLIQALDNFIHRDRLAQYVTLGERGLYVLPPSARWLEPEPSDAFQVRPFPVPSGTPALPEDAFYPRHSIQLYEMTPASLRFFHKVFHNNHEKLTEGGELRPDLLLLAKGLAKLVYGARIPEQSSLFKLLTQLFASDVSNLAIPVRPGPSTAAGVGPSALLGGPNNPTDTEQAGAPEASEHTQELLRTLGEERIAFDARLRELAHSERSHEPGPSPMMRNIKSAKQEYENKVRARRDELRSSLTREQLDRVLGAHVAQLRQATIDELVADAVIQDAENTRPLPQDKKAELDTIVEDCREGALEAEALNSFAGEYMTFSC